MELGAQSVHSCMDRDVRRVTQLLHQTWSLQADIVLMVSGDS